MDTIILTNDYKEFKSQILQVSEEYVRKYSHKKPLDLPVFDYITGKRDIRDNHDFILNLSLARYIIENLLDKNKTFSNRVNATRLKSALQRAGVYCPRTDLNILSIIDGFGKWETYNICTNFPTRISSRSIKWLYESRINVVKPVTKLSHYLPVEEFVWVENNQVLSTPFKVEHHNDNLGVTYLRNDLTDQLVDNSLQFGQNHSLI